MHNTFCCWAFAIMSPFVCTQQKGAFVPYVQERKLNLLKKRLFLKKIVEDLEKHLCVYFHSGKKHPFIIFISQKYKSINNLRENRQNVQKLGEI